MKTLTIIQARMGSSRLPGKVLKPLGKTLELDYVVSRCQQIKDVSEVIVATSTLQQDDAVMEWCGKNNVSCFRGSEHDVLSRYYECAKVYHPDYVMRVTADCPFVDYHLAEEVVTKMKKEPADIVLLKGEMPRGLAVELISFSALEYIHANGNEERHREHVTYYAYEFLEKFHSMTVQVPESMQHPRLRITLDTEEDYMLCQMVADYFTGDKLVPAQQVVDYLLAHPEVANLNAHIEQKPVL